MTRSTKYLALFTAALLASLPFWLSRSSPNSPARTKLAVIFVGMTNNPIRTMGPPRVEVCGGATGLCALFLVTNITRDECLWFKTAFAEQKAGGEWKQFVPGTNAWSGVEGSLWTPAYGCFMAVGWPPGLSTNASWRLQVNYGRDPSILRTLVNQKFGQPVLGRELFYSGKQENMVGSSEVTR
jgi:hypothetical protein